MSSTILDEEEYATSLSDDPPSMDITTTATSSVNGLASPSRTPVTNMTTSTAAMPYSSALIGKRGVCRIEVARVGWMTSQPWQRAPQSKSSGTGFCIDGRRLLTNAHVVRLATDIRVRPHGSTKRFPAKVVVYAPDVDLAVLRIDGKQQEEEFFKHELESSSEALTTNGGPPSKRLRTTTTTSSNGNHGENGNHNKNSMVLELADTLPALQESVHVVGYPTGGRTICITEGVVSRIDLVSGESSIISMLAIQIDAAINPGNSGGPAFDASGKVTGVAFCKSSKSKTDNIGYLIPANIVRTFLGRCSADGTYTLSPSLPYRCHGLENQSLRLANAVPPNVHGVLLTSISNTLNGALLPGDVLTKIDDKDVADDGQVVLRGDELIQHSYLLRGKRVDESTTFCVYRNGKHITCPSQVLGDIPSICVRWATVDYQPDYLILGTLVLLPMSWTLRSNKKCGTGLQGDCIDWCRRWPSEWEGKEGLVILSDIMAHELSFSYQRPWRRVVAYNGTPVLSLRHLRDLWEESCAAVVDDNVITEEGNGDAKPTFARISLENDDDVVLEVKAAVKAQREILETHQIPKPWNISPPNNKYK